MASNFGKQKFEALAFISSIVKLVKPIHKELILEIRMSANMKRWQQLIFTMYHHLKAGNYMSIKHLSMKCLVVPLMQQQFNNLIFF